MFVGEIIDYFFAEVLPQPIPGPLFASKEEVIRELSEWFSHLPEGWSCEIEESEGYLSFNVICPHGKLMVGEGIYERESDKNPSVKVWDWDESGWNSGCFICEENMYPVVQKWKLEKSERYESCQDDLDEKKCTCNVCEGSAARREPKGKAYLDLIFSKRPPKRPFKRKAIPPLFGDAPKISRNAPCPCGSGKKYKKCCLK